MNRVHYDDRMTVNLNLFRFRQTQLNVKLDMSKKIVIDTTGILKENLSKEIYDRLKRRNYDFTVLVKTFDEVSYKGDEITLDFERKDKEGQEAELLWAKNRLTVLDHLSPYHYYCIVFKCFYMTDRDDDRTMIIIGDVLWKAPYVETHAEFDYEDIPEMPHRRWMD